MSVDNLSYRHLSNKNPTGIVYYLDCFFLSIANEFAASEEKSTEPRLRRLSSDILTKRSATEPRNVGIDLRYTAIIFDFVANIMDFLSKSICKCFF